MGRPPRVKHISKEEGERVDIHRFPNFSTSGSVTGMRNLYYGKMPFSCAVAPLYIMYHQNPQFTKMPYEIHNRPHNPL